MNAKWCASTLFIILALLGLSTEHKRTSNQQILLEFADVAVTSGTAQDEILATIAKKLQVLGIDSIEIVENDGTRLNIRYYSDIDALSVKEFLFKEGQCSMIDTEAFPFDYPVEELPEKYHVVVSDLHLQADDVVALNGTLVPSQKQAGKIFTNSVGIICGNSIAFEADAIVHIAYKINRNIALSINNTLQKIPEVRAGPYLYGNT